MTPWLKKLHKWLALLVGVQLLIWVITGLLFSLLDPGLVSGRALKASSAAETPRFAAEATAETAAAMQRVLARYPAGTVTEVQLGNHLSHARIENVDRPLLRVVTEEGVTLHRLDGSVVTIDGALALHIARADYAGDTNLLGTPEKIPAPNMATRRHSGSSWQIPVADAHNTTLYISAEDGRVLERRTDTWRLFDILWMLHIMDYTERTDFNNPVVIAFGFIALWLSASGFWLLLNGLRREELARLRQWWSVFSQRSSRVPVVLKNKRDGEQTYQLVEGASLYEALAEAGLTLPSECGGGGSCGQCVVQLNAKTPVNAIERDRFNDQQLACGYRLACQQLVGASVTA